MVSANFLIVLGNRYWEVQVNIGESVNGWVYWTWKVRLDDHVVTIELISTSLGGELGRMELQQRYPRRLDTTECDAEAVPQHLL